MKLYWSGLGVAIVINCNQKIKVGQHDPPPLPKKTKTNKQEKNYAVDSGAPEG